MIKISTLFWEKSPPLIGLDIGASGVFLVELSDAGKGNFSLERCVFEPLPLGAVVDGNIENMDIVSEAVAQAWRKSSAKTKHVALGMPTALVITKKIVLPAGLSEEELASQVEIEAGQYIPFALEEVSLDFSILGSVNNATDVEVLVAASRKEKVEDRVAAVQAVGLSPVVMDIETYAAHAALFRLHGLSPEASAGQVIALFQIGATKTHLSIVQDDVVVYEHEQRFGGNQLTQEISRVYGLSFEEAELKKKSGDLPGNYGAQVLLPFLEGVASEIVRSIQFFFTSSHLSRVDHIYLAGGNACLAGFAGVVTEKTNVPTSIADPFVGMRIDNRLQKEAVHQNAPAYLVACGLAMRRFD